MHSRGTAFVLVTVIVWELVGQTWAARRVDAQQRARDTMRRRRELDQLQQRDEMPLDVKQLFKLTEGESLEEVAEVNDAYGDRVERLQETYKGIKLYDTVVTVHKTKDGRLTGEAFGSFVQDIANDLLDTEASISDTDVLDIALKEEGDNMNDVSNVKYSKEIYLDDKNQARLVNVMSYLIDGEKRPSYIIDTKNGEILKHWEGLTSYPCCERKYKASGGNERTGEIIYGNMPYCMTPTISNGTCYLENEYVRVIDDDISYSETAYFDCETGPEDAVNGAYSPAADAFFYGTVVGKMFEEWFNSIPLRDVVILKVHVGRGYENAYWTGEYCAFGDGNYTFYPLTGLDIVGHEIGHGVTEFSSNLEYWGESGGINEAFSDMMGEASEDYLLKSDFLSGYSIMKTEPYLREFERPENDNYSISHVDDMSSWLDVHYSSGIYRRIWYVVVKEEGMSVRDAFSVFLHANKMYWHETSSFYDASCGVLKAALDLGYDTQPFRNAFQDVGIKYCTSAYDVPILNVNETQYGILVSDTINPLFIMETPEEAENCFVDLQRNSSKDVLISVTLGGWNVVEEGGWNATEEVEMVAEDVNYVTIPECSNITLHIQLSLSDTATSDECEEENNKGVVAVDITAGYTIKDEPEC